MRTRIGKVATRARSAAMTAGLVLAVALGTQAVACAAADFRIRVQEYSSTRIYRLKGYVGYQIDLEFEVGEHFVGIGAGDLESLTFAAQGNHLFLKPRAAGVETNLTVLTSRRVYQFDYVVGPSMPDPGLEDVVYVLRFSYPQEVVETAGRKDIEPQLARAADERWHNLNYTYCGSPGLKPALAWDDGVQTHLRFSSQQELPAIFASNDDASESLVNFTIESDEIVVHRVGRQLVVRRGRLSGRIFNNGFTGGGQRLESGTVTESVERLTREARP